MVAQQNVTTQICQQCGSSPASVRCRDSQAQPFFCADCDVSIHRNHVFHIRDATTTGFFQPLPPTTCVVERALSQCVCIVPLEMAEKICSCSPGSLSVNTGKVVAVVAMNGQYDLSMPEMKCEACNATWSAGVDDLTGKITADRFRKSFLEREAARFEVDKICREEHFVCPACTPDMLAVSVDGNHEHYRFKNAARSLEEVSVEGSGQLPGKRLRDPQNKLANKPISFFAMDVTCKYWPYLNKVANSCPELQHLLSMKPFLSVFHAKAHDFKCEATKRLESQLQDLESMRIQLAVTQAEVEGWVTDIKEWAEGESYTITSMSQFCRIVGDMLLQVITVLK
ncbi:unnamed protein product [Leuciscus chuanchicus]